MFEEIMKRSLFPLCLIAAALPLLASVPPNLHLELALHMQSHRADHPMPAYTRDEVVTLAGETPTAEVVIAYIRAQLTRWAT